MNFEKDIPDYAMVPAKELDEHTLTPITKDAIYSPVQTTNIQNGQKISVVIEEDILVPDTKPDLKEILIMEGDCSLSTREVNNSGRKEEYINISGQLELQTLYIPEKADKHCPIISIETKIPFKEQLHISTQATMVFHCKIDKIEYTVVNERKYRIKATLIINSKEYNDCTINLFEGLADDNLLVLKEKVCFSHLALRKKDILSVKEYISPISDVQPSSILMKKISVVENYKQLATDKIVVNGFICVNSLCCDKSPIDDLSPADNMFQLQEKVEFTQFIPLSHVSSISDCSLSFDCSQLKLKITQHEDGHNVMCLDGDLITYVELYKKMEKDVIVDAYHKEKNFVCNFTNTNNISIVGSANAESSVREIFVPKNINSDVESILFTTGEIAQINTFYEQGKIICEGKILAKMICSMSDENHSIASLVEEIPFRLASSIPELKGNEHISFDVVLKDFWSEKINGKQLEFNATIMSKADAIKETSFKLLTNPAFDNSSNHSQSSPMVIYCCKQGDTLWQIAKKFKTSTNTIMDINQLENDNLSNGMKLLITK